MYKFVQYVPFYTKCVYNNYSLSLNNCHLCNCLLWCGICLATDVSDEIINWSSLKTKSLGSEITFSSQDFASVELKKTGMCMARTLKSLSETECHHNWDLFQEDSVVWLVSHSARIASCASVACSELPLAAACGCAVPLPIVSTGFTVWALLLVLGWWACLCPVSTLPLLDTRTSPGLLLLTPFLPLLLSVIIKYIYMCVCVCVCASLSLSLFQLEHIANYNVQVVCVCI